MRCCIRSPWTGRGGRAFLLCRTNRVSRSAGLIWHDCSGLFLFFFHDLSSPRLAAEIARSPFYCLSVRRKKSAILWSNVPLHRSSPFSRPLAPAGYHCHESKPLITNGCQAFGWDKILTTTAKVYYDAGCCIRFECVYCATHYSYQFAPNAEESGVLN